MDHEAAHSDHMKLRVDEIAERLSVTRRTVYSMIEREGWLKEEGARGRVWYHVPLSFMDEYIRSSQEDQSRSQKTIHADSQLSTEGIQQEQSPSQQPIVNNIELFIEQLKLAHDATVKAKDETIEELKKQIESLKEDKAVMTRQIEAGNTAMVTMREAKRMQEEAKSNSSWLSWFKR